MIGTIRGTPAPASTVVAASADVVNPDLVNLVEWVPPAQRYSYLFEGSAQVLDHALITQNLSRLVSRVSFSRSNADQPETSRATAASPARLSDHDGIVVGFAAGTASVQASVESVSADGGTVVVRFRNSGTGNLFNLTVDSLRARTLLGTGTVVALTAVPTAIAPVLGPGQSVTATFTLSVPSTVTRYALAEGGTYQNAAGATPAVLGHAEREQVAGIRRGGHDDRRAFHGMGVNVKTRTRIGATLAAALCAIFLGAQAASAAPLLNITLAPNPIEGSAGGALVDITYSIENVSGFEVTLVDVSASNIDAATGVFDGLVGDWFFLQIADGATVTGLLGQFEFFSTAIVGTTGLTLFDVGFEVGQDGPQTSENATLRYRVVDGDTPTVPEPTILVLLGLAVAGAAAARRRS